MKKTVEDKKKAAYKMRKEYAANRKKQLNDPDLLKFRPYWQYICNGSQLVPCHLEWDKMVLHHSDPWWKKNFPPNDPECRCYISAVCASKYTGQIAPTD